MPLYEYLCPNCGKKQEVLNPTGKVVCKCRCKMKKLISAPAFRVYTKVR